MISIVSPVYKAERLVHELVKQIQITMREGNLDYEIILVEDGSPDNSWMMVQEICKENKEVTGIKLSRNFGQHYAITAGLENANGDWVIVMDCDLQDDPSEIPNLYAKAQTGFDIVYAKRKSRKDSLFKRLSSKAFYKVFSYMTNTKQDPEVANFGIYSKNVISAILSMKDHIRFFPTMSQWVGFKSTYYDVSHKSRLEGKSSYSWKTLFKLAFDNIISFSDKPLRMVVRFGILISLVSFLLGAIYIYKYLSGDIVILGFTSLIISIWFLSGIIILILGVVGLYLAKTFDRVKDRPTYIVEQMLNV